ncbi:aldehyde dehydrogenase family protein [Halomonas denitrificans]|uniref:aldehyde dehydrogenase family protein n=1 Tax=Halomonas denitrificans TaxID=370769 RepID=UPI001CD24E43|nr:aldehyde dehydrogenase family protein [Halomonas denitrificans]MCA0975864.1 aldehyde dehydrogenase family protein [Halomonas denitrificans]
MWSLKDLQLQPIAGEWRDGGSGKALEVYDPYHQTSLIKIVQADRHDVDRAFETAQQAQQQWSATSAIERAAVLRKVAERLEARKDELIEWLVRESGSTRIKAELEWNNAREMSLEAAAMATRVQGSMAASSVPGKEDRVYRKPLGVIGVISPWNFPFHLTQRTIGPALALGNAVVLKPASDTPLTGGLLLARLYEEAGLPAGLLSVVVGSGSELGTPIVEHRLAKLISFTGSTEVGRQIAKGAVGGRFIKPVALELGGNSPFVVLDDADIDQAVRAAVVGKFMHQGQICIAINRLIVDATIYDEFVERFVERVKGLKVGDPAESDTVIGPIINEQQLEGLKEVVHKARQSGAKVALEGSLEGPCLRPWVFRDVSEQMDMACNEIFGPVAGIIKAHGEDDAIRIANATEYGLSAAVFSGSLERGERVARQIDSGMVHVNDMPVNDEPHMPFGGEKNSGIGRFNGDWVLEEMTTVQWVSVQREPRQYPF